MNMQKELFGFCSDCKKTFQIGTNVLCHTAPFRYILFFANKIRHFLSGDD